MSLFKMALCASAVALSTQAFAAEVISTQAQQKDLALTIYQNGLGFVRDARSLKLKAGDQNIAFEDVSAQLVPDSLLISGNGFGVKERRFAFDILTPQILLEKSLGQTVTFRRMNPVTGKDELITGKILSTHGQVIIERDGKIEVGQPGNLVLDKLPEGLRPRPAMFATLAAAKTTDTDLALAYLTGGVKWHTSYSAKLDDAGNKLTLNAWANLTNTSGVDYKNVRLSLAAGSVNRRSSPQRVQMMAKTNAPRMAMAADAGMAENFAAAPPQAIGGIHLYNLQSKLDLNQKETKQVALMAPMTFEAKRTLVQTYGPVYGSMGRHSSQPTHPRIEIEFTNTSGQPLPNGITRLYRKDNAGEMQFVGEDNLKKTPNKNKAKLHPGQSFDVTLKRTQTAYERRGKDRYEATYETVIKNAKKTKETIRIEDHFPGEWDLDDTSHKPAKKEGQRSIWKIDVPAGGEIKLTYTVDVKLQ